MSYHSRQPSVASSIVSNPTAHPQFIGPWRLGKTLGRGATGRVLLATHRTNNQKAAVKVVSKSELDEEEIKKSNNPNGLPYGIEREIIIMKLLTHPNVLRLHDVWETSKNLYLVLEYVEGGELFDLLVERGPLPENEAIKYFRQIILGTAYCHALGICHRDLKPENLLLDNNLNVKLADFGMAALESNGKLLETSCGSPHYAAPEIVSGLKYHGFASDVWSCGVILFALLTGRLPFDDENIRDLLLKVQAGSFEMPMDISFEAQDLIAKMLTVNPDSRIKTELILKHPLLNKYPIPNEDLISVKSLPHPQTAYKSLGSVKNIDKQILQNLSILWNDRSQQDIINSLLTNGPNPEKTFYALLLRYRHNQDDPINSPKNHLINNNNGRFPPRSNSIKNMTPRKARASQISASSSRHRPVSFQYKNGVRNSMLNGRISTSSSVNNSPYKSPYRSPRHQTNTSPRKFQYGSSPQKSGSPRRSPFRSSPSNRAFVNPNNTSPAVPRNIYNEIVSAQNNGSFKAMPPPLPSKDSMGHYEQVETYNARHSNDIPYGNQGQGQAPGQVPGPFQESAPLGSHDLMASANVSPSKKSNIPKSNSKNRLSRRKSFRMSMHNGLKRNSITVKLLSTYAKLAGETDWEYMEKQTKRTSATFATLCDKIFNEEQYDQDDENLVDEEEKRALEYERLMEIERKKHEAEMRARKELAKQRRRQKRRSLLSSKKLSIIVKDDDTNAQSDITASGNELTQPKRQSKAQNNGLRSISEGTGKEERDDELTREDLEKIKKRSVTQPAPKPRTHPVLTRRPVSRLDPLWTAYENEELNRAKDALDAEYKDAKAERTKKDKRRVSRANRESMISVMDNSDDEDQEEVENDHKPNRRSSKSYKLPDVDMERSDLSEEYLTEIRKSRLLNSQMNIHGIAKGEKNIEVPKKGQKQKTLIGDVDIPNVTRKSRHFTNSNKRLSVLSMYSTKESYHDLNSIVHNEGNKDKAKMSQMRTSFADRLDRAGLDNYDNEEDEEPLDEGSILDFDEHLANKRSSYYAGPRSNTVKRHSKPGRPTSDLPDLPPTKGSKHAHIADETFATKHDGDYKEHRGGGEEDYYGGVLDQGEESEEPDELEEGETKVFDNIKLPPTGKDGKGKERSSKTKSMQPSAESMLLPDLGNGKGNGGPRTKPYASTKAKGKDTNYPAPTIDNEPPYDKPRTTIPKPKSMGQKQRQKPKPLEDSTNRPQEPKKNKSIFRKLSWGSKKTFDDISNPQQLPSPVDSRDNSYEETNTKPAQRQNSFFRWFSSSSSSTAQAHETTPDAEIRRFHTILPKQEMSSALFALLNSWSNFGLKNLKNDTYAYIITGAISRHNAFNLKSCKFRIKINPREFNQKSEIVCARVKGSRVTSNTLFKEIEKVLCKEGVMDN